MHLQLLCVHWNWHPSHFSSFSYRWNLKIRQRDTLYKHPENFYRKYNNPKYHCKVSRHMEKASTTPRSCGAWIPLYLIPCKNKLTYLGDVGRKNIPLNKVSQWRGGQYRGLYKLRRIYWSWNWRNNLKISFYVKNMLVHIF